MSRQPDSTKRNFPMRYSISAAFLAALAVAVTPDQSRAQPAADVIEVTGTIIPSSNAAGSQPGASLSQQEIELTAASTVTDLLRIVPGLHITQQGGEGGLTFISIRGGDPNFTVILIDGVKVNDPTNSRGGAFDLSALDPAIIERIDIFYGSYSPVLGSDALSGLISFTTKRAGDNLKTNVTAEGGSDDAWAASGHISGRLGEAAEAALSASIRDGGDAVAGDSLRRKQLNARLRSPQGAPIDWSFSFLFADGSATAFPEDSGGDRLAVIRQPDEREFEQMNIGGTAGWQASSVWNVKLASSWARHEENTDSPGIAPGVFQPVPATLSDSIFERFDLSLTNTARVTSRLDVGFGGSYAHEKGRTDSIIDFGFPIPAPFALERDIWSAFGEVSWTITANLGLTAGVRHDDAGAIDATTTRFAADYQMPETGTAFFFQFGEGFKLPSFFALGQPFVGNPMLRSERSTNYDFTVEQAFLEEKLRLTGSIFRNKFRNLVDFDPGLFLLVNRSRVIARGGEFQADVTLTPQITVNGEISYTDTDTDEAGVNLRRRPKWRGGGRVAYSPTKTLRASFIGLLVGRFKDSSIPTGNVRMPGYERFDISAEWSPLAHITIRAALTNIFNAGFEETVGFSSPGRQARLILTARY